MLKSSVFAGCTEVVQLLIADPRVDPTVGNNICVRLACEYGHTTIVEQLLAIEAVDPMPTSWFDWTTMHRSADIVRLLLHHPKVDLSFHDGYTLRWAAEHGHADLVPTS